METAFTEFGKKTGSPLLLIHAFPLTQAMWTAQTEKLAEKHRVVTYDLRGFGKSPAGTGQCTIDTYVDDLLELMDKLKTSKAILCGLSMGGYIALRAKERNPERVAALILADTRTEGDSDEGKIKRGQAVKTLQKGGLNDFTDGFLKGVFAAATPEQQPQILEHARKMILSNTPLGICGALIAMAARTDTSKALTEKPVPTLILVGEEDKLTPPAASQAMKEKCASSKLVQISKAGHLSAMENPAEFNAAVLAFCDAIPQ